LIPKIPLFHHSNIPIGVLVKLHSSGVKSKPGPLDPDLYLPPNVGDLFDNFNRSDFGFGKACQLLIKSIAFEQILAIQFA